jgi:hypothetical protein
VDFAKALPFYFQSSVARRGTPEELEEWLQDTPCFVSGQRRTIFPTTETAALLHDKWMST